MSMTNIELYNEAKKAYYEGNPIMGDAEFDELEKSLNLENTAPVGSSSENYTIEHPFVMGSLSKVQIKEDKNGNTDWMMFTQEIMKYLKGCDKITVTPKYDGCSFEALVRYDDILSISTRGDGKFGKDISKHINTQVMRNVNFITEKYHYHDFVIRGEVLVKRSVFDSKYTGKFANTRAFVAGTLNSDYSQDLVEQCDDLSVVVYDFRTIDRTGVVEDKGWEAVCNIPDAPYKFDMMYKDDFDLEDIYNDYAMFREISEFALDGIVVKPIASQRINDLTETRPKDCVAIKFKPMMQETEITGIEWQLGKSREYSPVVVFKPIEIDGKIITRASGHNYGYIKENRLGIGAKVKISMAGDIIPFIYEVVAPDESFFANCADYFPESYIIDGVHMMADMDQNEINRHALLNSILSAEITGVGDAAAQAVVDYVTNRCKGNEFFDIAPTEMPVNILQLTTDDFVTGIGGKNGAKVGKAFDKWLKELTIAKAVYTMNIPFCGHRVSEQIENYLLGKKYDFTSMAREGYEWVTEKYGMYDKFIEYLKCAGYTIDTFKTSVTKDTNYDKQVPIIMTGDPTTCKTKAEFLQMHPEYRNTTSWKEVQIVFTNDLNSNTGKMKKARDKGIEIRLY